MSASYRGDLTGAWSHDPETGCWVWQRSLLKNGYACIRRRGRTEYAHRWIYRGIKGPIPAGLELDHLCRNRACVNPEHLEAVTRIENVRRGKATKLTIAQVREIRSRGAEESRAALGREFGVSAPQIGLIVRGKSWREVIA